MKFRIKYPGKDWLYIITILILFLIMMLFMIEILEYQNYSLSRFIKDFLISFPFLFVLTLLNSLVAAKINRFLFLFNHLALRVCIELVYVIISAVAFIVIGNTLILGEPVSNYINTHLFLASAITAVILNFVSMSLIEIMYHNELNRQKSVAYERMQKEHAEMLYNQLKGQINPHFLFNSFNILNSLIEADNSRAKNFVYQLSDIYRYILTYNSNQLIHLEKEINFIQSYIRILQIRFSSALDVRIDVPKTLCNKSISPMTLQLLVENAVKHNIASVRNPLFVHIYCDAGFIIVENNLNPKPQLQAGTGVGLKNIRNKYELLGQSNIKVLVDQQKFTVKIPLL